MSQSPVRHVSTRSWTGSSESPPKLRCIGSGTYGTVSEVATQHGRMALKEQKIDSFTGSPSLNELDIGRKVVHPNIMPIEGIVVDGTNLGFIMPLAHQSLVEYVSKKRSEPMICRLMADVFRGLSFLHSNGILHLDMKGGNILIDETDPDEPIAKISDFGLSKHFHGRLDVPARYITCTFAPPEILSENRMCSYTPRTESWCLGIIFLTSLRPDLDIFQGVDLSDSNIKRNTDICNRLIYLFNDNMRMFNLKSWLPDSSSQVVSIIHDLLSINPSMRLTSDEALYRLGCSHYMGVLVVPSIEQQDRSFKSFKAIEGMARICYNMNYLVETFFLACDIYHRCSHLHDPEDIIPSCSVVIASKLTELTQLKITSCVKENVSPERLRRCEVVMIDSMKGIIYRKNLFTCSTITTITDNAKLCYFSDIYSRLDMIELNSQASINNVGSMRCREFLPHTCHFKIMAELQGTDEERLKQSFRSLEQ
uniref:Protein kinase domain-containing protein n=1 Tax=viral metagenome TaxID=1070528 RepID=A0A6C0BME2_9ZZZZ